VAQVAAIADGVIVGSAIVRQIGEHQHDPALPERIGRFVKSLKTAMNGTLSAVS
jgi:tryptophan synthase alpha chain